MKSSWWWRDGGTKLEKLKENNGNKFFTNFECLTIHWEATQMNGKLDMLNQGAQEELHKLVNTPWHRDLIARQERVKMGEKKFAQIMEKRREERR